MGEYGSNPFIVRNSDGEFVKRIHAFRQIIELVEKEKDTLFVHGDASISEEGGAFTYHFGRDVQPQHIRRAYIKFFGYPDPYPENYSG